jgi:hypothetical protein
VQASLLQCQAPKTDTGVTAAAAGVAAPTAGESASSSAARAAPARRRERMDRHIVDLQLTEKIPS